MTPDKYIQALKKLLREQSAVAVMYATEAAQRDLPEPMKRAKAEAEENTQALRWAIKAVERAHDS